MSQPKETPPPSTNPIPSGTPGGIPTHVHHPGTTPGAPGATGTPAVASADSEPVTPEDYNNSGITDYLLTALPQNLRYEGEVPVAAGPEPSPTPAPSITADQAARDAGDGIYQGLTRKQSSFWAAVRKAGYLGLLQDDLDIRALKGPPTFNAASVPDGGVAVLKALQLDTRAKLMQVPVEDLGKELARLQRIRRAKEEIGAVVSVLDANESATLARISGMVNKGLKIGESSILADGNLARLLGPAFAIRGGPADAAVATRAEKARTEKAIRADEQSRLAEAATEAAKPSTTVNTSVSVPDPTKAAPGAAPPAASPAHKKK